MTDLTLCPACQKDHHNAPLCPHCGFDLADYAFANTKRQKELVAAHQKNWVGHVSIVEVPSPITETEIKRADNPMEFVEYQAAVNMAWADKKLEAFEVNHLNVLAQKLNLSLEQTETIEREIIGRSIREECYCAMLLAARNTHGRFSLSKLTALPTRQRKTGLSADVTRQLEQALLGQTLLAVLIPQLKKDAAFRVELEELRSSNDLAKRLKDKTKCWPEWSLAAQQGIPEGQCLIGLITEIIDGNNQNAFEWYHKAAEQGLADAQYHLGILYQKGRGVIKNKDEAKRWYQQAAAQGHNEAQEKLDACFITTATINALGISNGETVLNQFRVFRDGWLIQQAFGAAAIARYYDIAPDYIEQIDQQADAAATYRWLWSDYLALCHTQLQQNDYPAAYHTYRAMLAALSQRFSELG